MAGGVHASSPGPATVTHQMGHSVLPPEYAFHTRVVVENGVNVSNETGGDNDINVASSTTLSSSSPSTRKRKYSGVDNWNLDHQSKRMRVCYQFLFEMILEKEKYLYVSLLDEYGRGHENDIFAVIDKNSFSKNFVPFVHPQIPKSVNFLSEPEHFRKLFPNDVISKLQPNKIKQELDTSLSDQKACSSPVVSLKSVPVRGQSTSSDSNSQHIVEKAKQEAYVLQRVAELQKCGMWTEKRLPKVHEPHRMKAHWDYVLEELEWLATDFAQERKWKKAAARKRSRMIQKHFQEREALVQKALRAAEVHKRKIASHLAKIVKTFWSNVEKLVDFKQQTMLKEKRQQALDQHLSFIVNKTEQYSSLVAESMNRPAMSTNENSRVHSPSSDADFEPNQVSSSDDEETIEAEEKANVKGDMNPQDEISMLQRESKLPIEDLVNQYVKNRHEIDDDYEMDEDTSDDERTIMESEKHEGNVNHAEELAELEEDQKLSLADLKKKYYSSVSNFHDNSSRSSAETSSESEEEHSIDEDDVSMNSDDVDAEELLNDENNDLISLMKDSAVENGDLTRNDDAKDGSNEDFDDVAAIAESIQPKGNTLSSTSVVTKVPFLLKHTLREYQHIGLDWLVTMYERKLNGILADEMGLGKTIQTIALLAHLASDKENWGPHLIIVPTSVMLNWEMEIKKWCPAFKILTYYGNPKERKLKRAGWTKPNTFHVCITSYKLILQDHYSFRRKKWQYLILDEAQNIKNFKSQRWQRLLNFDSERRLLLTGTPLQNNLMELWSMMHFLMPNLFSSHKEFKEWFSNPVSGMIEGNSEYNENIIKRLHKILRPFLLRRLKVEVEKQLPQKYEHVVMCRLSNRQRYLYDDFMSRAKTKETLSSGNLLSVINVLMQLRKVCNHPNLFEQRPIISPFQMENLVYHTASLADSALEYDPLRHVSLNSLNLRLVDLENYLSAWCVYRLKKLKLPRKLIEEIDESPPDPPPLPKGKLNIRLKTPNDVNTIKVDNNVRNNHKITTFLKKASASNLQASGSAASRYSPSTSSSTVKLAPIFRSVIGQGEINNMAVKRKPLENSSSNKGGYTLQVKRATKVNTLSLTKSPTHATLLKNVSTLTAKTAQANAECTTATTSVVSSSPSTSIGGCTSTSIVASDSTPSKLTNSISQLVSASAGKSFIFTSASAINKSQSTTTTVRPSGQRIILTKAPLIKISNSSVQQGTVLNNGSNASASTSVTSVMNNTLKSGIPVPRPIFTVSPSVLTVDSISSNSSSHNDSSALTTKNRTDKSKAESILMAREVIERRNTSRKEKLRILAETNEKKSSPYVMFGCDVRNTLKVLDANSECSPMTDSRYWNCVGHVNCVNAQYAKHVHSMCSTLTSALSNSVKSIEERIQELCDTFSRYIVYVPAVNARRLTMHVSHPHPSKAWSLSYMECALEKELTPRSNSLHQIVSRMSTAFPDSRLIQYDCGKLQTLDTLLRRLKLEQHRVLIFTQMARMLDVLEAFLTFHGYIYLRLDGSTRIDQRQVLMERFNADKRYFCFILSTRSGGIGVNLTGADTVIFYDSDWNPTMDAQAQDRCHRIGQTRDVHIYRLISEKTIEENILKKANQKKLLGELAIEGGNFTAAYFRSTTIHDLFTVDLNETDPAKRMSDVVASDAPTQGVEKATLNAYENALAAAEDETDVVAARTAKEEAVAELAEFDETIPLVDNECGDLTLQSDELSKAEQEVNALIEQLTPIERWALQFMETVDTEWADEQLAAAEAEIEQQKKEWEMERMAIEQADEQSKRFDEDMEDDDSTLTYRIEDSKNQAWISIDSLDYMPIWLPLPTNSSAEEYDVYVDRTLKFLYETTAIPEHLLPPVYTRKEKKKPRLDQPSPNAASENAYLRVRNRVREGSSNSVSVASLEPPKSLFDRPSPIVSKLRHDMRLQKYRGLPRSTIPNVPGLKPYFSPKVTPDPEFVPDWMIHEDYTLLRAIQHVQELPLNLSVMYPGHTPNWDLISELVNQVSVIYRSPQQCKNRFEITILPREEGKLSADPLAKKNKKVKGMSPIISHKHTRSYKTTQQYLQDSNGTFTKMMNARFDAIRAVSNRRAPTIRRLPITTSTTNPRHAQLLAECDIDFDRPLTPVEIATKRAQRLAKEKQTQMASAEQLLLRQAANVSSTGQQQTPKAAQPQPAVVQQLPSSPQIQQQLQSQIVNVQKAVPITASNVVLTQQQVPPTATAVVVSMNSNPTITAVAPILTRTTLVGSQVNVQEMIVTNKLPQQPQEQQQLPQQTATAVVSNNGSVAISSPPQKIRTIAQISAPNTVTVPRLPDGKLLTSAQVHFYRQQQALQRQPQPQFAIFRSRSKTPVMVPANVVVSSSQQQTRQIKSVTGPVTTSAARTITEAEVQALLKKQQTPQQLQQQQLLPQQQQPKIATSVIATTNFSAVQTAQFLTTSASAPQAKTAVGIPLSTIKTTTINASNLKTTGTVPQFRQITIPQTLQQRKITTQKVTPIGQVMVNVTQSGQVFSQVLTKSTQGSVATAQLMNARVIPFISSPSGKPTIQVVNAASLRPANTSTVTVDTSGARHIQPTNTIKISSSPSTVAMTTLTSHQHLLNQVSAALQGSPPLAVRQANLKIQSATMAAPNTTSTVQGNIVTAAPGQIITLPAAQSQQQTITAEKVTIFSDSDKPTGAIID